MDGSASRTIWRLLDGRPGHENQVMGLSTAVSRLLPCRTYDLQVPRDSGRLRSLFRRLTPDPASLPQPDLLIGAGHGTHWPLLNLQYRYGGQTVVIMKPSLPTALFDLCLIPEHDQLWWSSSGVVRTKGALTRIRASRLQDSQRGLILVGGPSKHAGWSSRHVLDQIHTLLEHEPSRYWCVSASTRTPAEFQDLWARENLPVELMLPEQTGRDWVPAALARSAQVWVTADSVSMTYEALTSGAAVGILELPPPEYDRNRNHLESLVRQQHVTLFSHWREGQELRRPPVPFRETDRCAAIVVQRCLLAAPRSVAAALPVPLQLPHVGRCATAGPVLRVPN